jgi:hypothetical protein
MLSRLARLSLAVIVSTASSLSPALAQADFADGLAGGPDFWEVIGLRAGGLLNVRAEASVDAAVVGKLALGAVVRNRGCVKPGTTIWCQIEALGDTRVSGWAASRFLREGAAPEGYDPPDDVAQADDALVPGTSFNATATIPCEIAGSDSTSCEAGVVRYSGGSATLFVTLPDGTERILEFQDEKFTVQGGAPAAETSKTEDLFTITVGGGKEAYTIADVFVYGD